MFLSVKHICKYQMHRFPRNVMCGTNIAVTIQTFFSIRKNTLEKSHINVRSVAKPLALTSLLFSTKGSTVGSDLVCANSVARRGRAAPIHSSAFTLERNPVSVRSVGKPSGSALVYTSPRDPQWGATLCMQRVWQGF